MSCQITNNITTPCNRSNGGIRKIYFGNGPAWAILSDANSGVVTGIYASGAPSYDTIDWYTVELPRVTGQFNETYEINQANGTVVYNQELSFVTNRLNTATRARVIELAQSTDMLVILEDNNGKQWLMGKDHGVHMRSGTAESGINYGDRSGYTIVLAAREPESAPEVFEGVTEPPIDPGELVTNDTFLFARSTTMLGPLVYPEFTNASSLSGWQSYYDTVTAYRQGSTSFGTLGYVFYFTTPTITVGSIAYNSFGNKAYANARGYILRVNPSSSSTWKIVDFENGVITSIVSWGNYTCSIPDPLTGTQYDPYYKVYYGYEYLGSTTIWARDDFTWYNEDAKAVIEAMPAGATPLYYKVIKHRGHIPQFNVTTTAGPRDIWWPFPFNGYATWNYDTNLRSDIPDGKGYLFNHNNEFNLDQDEPNVMFTIWQATGTLYCPLVSAAQMVSPFVGSTQHYDDV